MDDFVEAMVGSVVGIVFLLAIGAVIGAGWLIYKFCEAVLPPLCSWLGRGCAEAERRIAAWWREVTWERRTRRERDEALREMAEIKERNVATFRQLVAEVDRMQLPTADGTAAVRPVVRVAVPSR